MNSKVYLADDHQLGGKVAAKEIEKFRFANPVNYFQEAQAMFAVAHDHVVDVQYACKLRRSSPSLCRTTKRAH